MIPELQRFYGGDPMRWFDLPSTVLSAYVYEMERLRAAEKVSAIENISLVVGGGDEDARLDADDRIQELRRLAAIPPRKLTHADAGRAGIAITKESKKKSDHRDDADEPDHE